VINDPFLAVADLLQSTGCSRCNGASAEVTSLAEPSTAT